MGQPIKPTGTQELQQILAELNLAGGFTVSVLTDAQGLAFASAYLEGADPERQSAVVALVQKTASRAARQLGMDNAEEFSLFATDGSRLVCRSFQVNEFALMLAVMAPNKERTYRRAMNQAIHKIEQAWKQL
jgi:predicted regulator of Ras-like GTPase activity (Roadblock/LC7/MglB family)